MLTARSFFPQAHETKALSGSIVAKRHPEQLVFKLMKNQGVIAYQRT
jgi:hypothetical protein